MFDALSNRLQDVFQSLKGETRLTEATVERVLGEIRLALLEADVNFKVVKAFVDRVRDRAMDEEVQKGLNPSQQVIKIVRDELLALFGDAKGGLQETSGPAARDFDARAAGLGQDHDHRQAREVAGEAGPPPDRRLDRRAAPGGDPAAGDRGAAGGVRVHDPAGEMDPVARAKGALAEARAVGNDVVIVDTAGRLHIDDELMKELVAIKDVSGPSDLLYVADAMTGQDAIKSAGEFNAQIGVTGVVLTKIDGDARGGAALSVVSVVGVPIAFVGSGEKLDDLEPFHADRFVSRMLGMGDVLSLIEKAEEVIDQGDAEKLEAKIRKGGFTLEDFRDQLRMLKRMGPLDKILGMLPGMGGMKELAGQKPDEKQLGRIEAIINSMTPDERKYADILDGSRRKRVAKGSGTTVEDVNRLLKQFVEMQRMLKMVGQMTGEPIAAAPKKKKKKGPFSLMK